MAPLLSVLDDPALRDAIRVSMRGTESKLNIERAASAEGQLVEVLVSLIEHEHRDRISVGEIADAFRRKYGSEYDRPITPRFVGYLLRSRLHLNTVRAGGVFVITRAEQEAVRALGARFNTDGPLP